MEEGTKRSIMTMHRAGHSAKVISKAMQTLSINENVVQHVIDNCDLPYFNYKSHKCGECGAWIVTDPCVACSVKAIKNRNKLSGREVD